MTVSGAPRPEASTAKEYVFPNVIRSSLPNDLRVAIAPMTRLPLVTVVALVDAGAARDSAGIEGGASLTAHALGEGTEGLNGASLVERFEALGTGLDSSSDWDDATVSLTVTPSRLETAIALLGEVLTTPAFAEGEVERLKSERLADLLQQQAEPRSLADDKFDEFLYAPGSRYALPQAGNQASVAALDAQRVRTFHQQYYRPAGTTLIFVGDVTGDLAVHLTERALGVWSGATLPSVAAGDHVHTRTRRVHVVHKNAAPQSELRVGHRGVPRSHPDYFPIVVMNALLGGLFSSRINLNLRERKAYTYGARSAFAWRRGSGPFVVSAAVKTEVTDAAVREIVHEIELLREQTVDMAELSLATAYLDGVFPIRYETTTAVAEAIANADVHGLGDDYYTHYRDRVRAVTAADVRRAAESHLHPDELLVVAVGDANAIREPLESLGFGSPEVHQADDQT
jgi:zinc protease